MALRATLSSGASRRFFICRQSRRASIASDYNIMPAARHSAKAHSPRPKAHSYSTNVAPNQSHHSQLHPSHSTDSSKLSVLSSLSGHEKKPYSKGETATSKRREGTHFYFFHNISPLSLSGISPSRLDLGVTAHRFFLPFGMSRFTP